MGVAFFKKCSILGSDRTSVNILTLLVLNPLLLASLIVPFQAEASVFSFISSIFSGTQVKAEEVEPNSQNMILLQAVISPSQDTTVVPEKEIAIVGGTYLSPVPQVQPESKTIDDDQISIYVVHSGDTLPAIAKMFGVTVNTIRWGNDIKGDVISVGQTLVILPISGIKHIVKSGDTIQSIAKLHKGDVNEIMQYNNLSNSAKLTVGDIIVVPDGEIVATVSVKSGSSGVGKTSPSIPVYSGYYMRPIIGGIKTQGIHGHNGVDLAGSYGSNVLASASGQVIISKNSGYNGGYGSYVVIKHDNGTQTLYAHLSKTNVDVGDEVNQGQIIGFMGSTGKSTGVHVHFEIRGARNPF